MPALSSPSVRQSPGSEATRARGAREVRRKMQHPLFSAQHSQPLLASHPPREPKSFTVTPLVED